MVKNIVTAIVSGGIVVWIIQYILGKFFDIAIDGLFTNVKRKVKAHTSKSVKDFRDVVKSVEYKKFVNEVMKLYYGEEFFTNINNQLISTFFLKSSISKNASGEDPIRYFDSVCDKNTINYTFDVKRHQSLEKYKYYKQYKKIKKGTINFPNRPGYMLDEIRLNENGEISKIESHIGTYAENIYSNHILEYELYLVYKKYKNQKLDDPIVWDRLISELKIRNKIHNNITKNAPDFISKMKESLCKGEHRHSLLSVQMLVIVKSKRTHKYEIKMVKRSNRVAIAEGIYQFIPAGGFEILNDLEDHEYSEGVLQENYSMGCAVFREYLEELFNKPEYSGNSTGSVDDRLLCSKEIREIVKLIQSKKAYFQFLGSVIDLAGLRHELSFALVITDENYSEKQFIANEECNKGIVEPELDIGNFEDKNYIWKNIHGPSAVMWKLFKDTSLYNQII